MNSKTETPGPAVYSPFKQKTKSPAYTLKERAKTSYFDPSKEILSKPLPNKYNVKEDIIKTARFSEISLGYGEKMLGHYSNIKRENTPGPGDY